MRTLHIGHVLRKYNPAEWAGTETAVADLLSQLNGKCSSKVFCPRSSVDQTNGQLDVTPFDAFLPIIGLERGRREQLIQIGGNLMSFDLIQKLWNEKDLNLIHMHTLGLLGGIGRMIAKKRGLPLVVSLHGGLTSIPKKNRDGSLSYARLFSLFLKPQQVLAEADAVIVFNKHERDLLLEKYPTQKIVHIPHGIESEPYQKNYRELAYHHYPWIKDKVFCLVVGRIDRVKNQSWIIEQLPPLLKKIPNLVLGLLGPVTDEEYALHVKQLIKGLGLEKTVHFLGSLPPKDPLLIGLYQVASFTALPSLAEPFGLVILESWSAQTPVLASRVSGPLDIIEHRKNGWLFDLADPKSFYDAVTEVIKNPKSVIQESQKTLHENYTLKSMGQKTLELYQELNK